MSLSALSGVTFTALRAGFAGMSLVSPSSGRKTFLRAGRRGMTFFLTFMRPGTVNTPGPRLPRSFLIIFDMHSKTDATSLRVRPVSAEMSPRICVLVLGLTSVVFAFLVVFFFLAMEFESFHWSNSTLRSPRQHWRLKRHAQLGNVQSLASYNKAFTQENTGFF